MNGRTIALTVLAVVGIVFVGYGVSISDQGGPTITVTTQSSAADFETGYPTTEFANLTAGQQEAFQNARQTGGSVRVSESLDFSVGYIQYQDSYYRTTVEWGGDGNNGTAVFIAAGVLILVVVGIASLVYVD